MDNTNCKIQMLDLYFSKIDFMQERGKDDSDYNISFGIEYSINNDEQSKIKVTIDTAVTNKTKSIMVNLQTVGVFQIDKSSMCEEEYEHLIKTNTVAIIFPFIRSQISLITAQPGLSPIVIPPININALINAQETN